ncbi:isochorismate synthase [Thermaerobacillus caldiproteolyticus]|uniref:Isochorismate synthase MenF n=1 Tax=Thermaerobacillus caldiproteolyticus TaxID=247480 RepID=A0A7W0BXU0_9BACL|nr:isochorismate synthase [Anoxybacillus caldiproteolyticus]MBA2873925.1 menaquinone-specific isochorismate synthase [Anoxybacillus caldiproteolyticus]
MATLYQHKIQEQLYMIGKTASQPFFSWSQEIDDVDPFHFFALGETCSFRQRFYWSDRSNETVYVGLGCTYSIETTGNEHRFHMVESEWKRFTEKVMTHHNGTEAAPLLFGGFSFDPLKRKTERWAHFPDAKLIVPAVLLSVKKGRMTLTITVPSQNHEQIIEKIGQLLTLLYNGQDSLMALSASCQTYEEMAKHEWISAVQKAIHDIREGGLDKVVLAREARLWFDDRIEPSVVLQRLREQQPLSYLFAFEDKGNCFVGASPEQLVKREGMTCYSTCLAGSIRRGKTVKEDEQLGRWLLQDEKNLREHRFVVDMIKEAMMEVCENVRIPSEPQLLKMRDIQHLYTPVIGESRHAVSLFSLVERLHPTPALGGTPREKALKEIREIEPLDRGWYAAPIGWIDTAGNGEFAVAIRSGLLQGKEVSIFAGCGIVGDSEPLSEYEETRVKFKPMLSALGVEQDE